MSLDILDTNYSKKIKIHFHLVSNLIVLREHVFHIQLVQSILHFVLLHFCPQGISIRLYQFLTLSTFARWIAPAGSTFFGHTSEHSPTKVQPHEPSSASSASARRCSPWSRESRLYRCASAIAAGPMKSSSAPTTGQAA